MKSERTGLAAWAAKNSGSIGFFGPRGEIPARFSVAAREPGGRLRRWLGYKLYAVVYWLLEGHV